MSIHILVDENVPLANEAFAAYGTVETCAGRSIDAARVRNADALVVRSVTRIDRDLLAGSRVRFVGTATIGTDHVDRDWLAARGIAFAAAPGSNARSVAEYVVAALLEVETRSGRRFDGATIGVVGAGHVGSLVLELCPALGMRVLACDPPRAECEGKGAFAPLERLLDEADVITLHTPLERTGAYPTWHRIGARELGRLRPGALVVNTSRGAVVDGAALRDAILAGRVDAVLDVWEGEPTPDPALIEAVRIATPHVAGYSLDGKLAGTRMIAEALARFVGAPAGPPAALFEARLAETRIETRGSGRDALRSAVAAARPLHGDDAAMRALGGLAPEARAAAFDRLRREHPARPEFRRFTVVGKPSGAGTDLAPSDRLQLRSLGFRCPDG